MNVYIKNKKEENFTFEQGHSKKVTVTPHRVCCRYFSTELVKFHSLTHLDHGSLRLRVCVGVCVRVCVINSGKTWW